MTAMMMMLIIITAVPELYYLTGAGAVI